MNERNRLINERLMAWFSKQGRHDLPWRKTFSPYEVLVSEFMLQQTTVATITPRFQEWIKLFPSLEALADAEESQVLSAWQGLGYYARARRLHAVARTLLKEHSGKIPNNLKALLALPGIGPYTANALLAFAFDQPVEVLDTNIIRVIARLNNLTTPIDTKTGRALIKHDAEQMLPQNNGRNFASALMDLGAMICTSGEPKCLECPLEKLCRAETPASLPRKKPRTSITRKKEARLFCHRNNRLYLEKSIGPHWKGLWILPSAPSISPHKNYLTSITYPITRYRVTMDLYRLQGAIPKGAISFSEEELKKIAIPSPHRKAIEKILSLTK